MKNESEIKGAVREWIARKGGIQPEEITNETPFLEQGIISSMQLMELILYLESLSNQLIDVKSLKKGMMRNVDAIYQNFFG